MTFGSRDGVPPKPIRPKPHAMLGAGRLVSTLWKTGSYEAGWRFRFNLFRMGNRGRIEQRLTPSDLFQLLKLIRLLAVTLIDEDGLSSDQRRDLKGLAFKIEQIIEPGEVK